MFSHSSLCRARSAELTVKQLPLNISSIDSSLQTLLKTPSSDLLYRFLLQFHSQDTPCRSSLKILYANFLKKFSLQILLADSLHQLSRVDSVHSLCTFFLKISLFSLIFSIAVSRSIIPFKIPREQFYLQIPCMDYFSKIPSKISSVDFP